MRRIDPSILKQFVPLNGMDEQRLQELAKRIHPLHLANGDTVFRQGDEDGDLIYLLEGSIVMASSNTSIRRVITAGSEEAGYALAKLNPRPYTGICRGHGTVIRIARGLLDRMLEPPQGYEVVECDGSDPEWMVRVLADPCFKGLPPSCFDALFARLETMTVQAGQTILRQGERGKHYYLIKAGRACLVREERGGRLEVLGELGECQGFGEESLRGGLSRDATVTMLTDGVLMRLSAADYVQLMLSPGRCVAQGMV